MRVFEPLRNLFRPEPPRRLDNTSHFVYSAFLAVMVVLPFFIAASPDCCALSIGSFKLPPLCISKYLFDVDCPGCGLTRAFVLITHGRFAESFHMHRIAIPLYLFFAYLLFFHVACLVSRRFKLPAPVATVHAYASHVLILALILNWFVNLLF